MFHRLAEQVGGLADPRERLVTGMLSALRNVRDSPAMSSWFAATQRPIGGEMAEQSEAVTALVKAFVRSLGTDDPGTAERQARWLVRVMTSLLVFPGRDESDEREMLEEFVVPLVVAVRQPNRLAP